MCHRQLGSHNCKTRALSSHSVVTSEATSHSKHQVLGLPPTFQWTKHDCLRKGISLFPMANGKFARYSCSVIVEKKCRLVSVFYMSPCDLLFQLFEVRCSKWLIVWSLCLIPCLLKQNLAVFVVVFVEACVCCVCFFMLAETCACIRVVIPFCLLQILSQCHSTYHSEHWTQQKCFPKITSQNNSELTMN